MATAEIAQVLPRRQARRLASWRVVKLLCRSIDVDAGT
jgi:hypothetical protein